MRRRCNLVRCVWLRYAQFGAQEVATLLDFRQLQVTDFAQQLGYAPDIVFERPLKNSIAPESALPIGFLLADDQDHKAIKLLIEVALHEAGASRLDLADVRGGGHLDGYGSQEDA